METTQRQLQFCEVCLSALDIGDEDVQEAVRLIPTRDPDGVFYSLPICSRHLKAAAKLRAKYELGPEEILSYRKPNPISALEMLVIVTGVLKLHRDVLNATGQKLIERSEALIGRHLERR